MRIPLDHSRCAASILSAPGLGAAPSPTYLVRVPRTARSAPPGELVRELGRALRRELCGWARITVLERLEGGALEWMEDLRLLGAPFDERYRMLALRCADQRGPQRPGLWAARCVAQALADQLGGLLFDPRCALEAPASAPRLSPPADGGVCAIDHLRVPCSRSSEHQRWITTVGLGHFGLPDLELAELAAGGVQLGAALLLGVAQSLIDAGARAPRSGARRELLLRESELRRALGTALPSKRRGSAWGSTRLALRLAPGGEWPSRWRVIPAAGDRRWRDCTPWLERAWSELLGAPGPAYPPECPPPS